MKEIVIDINKDQGTYISTHEKFQARFDALVSRDVYPTLCLFLGMQSSGAFLSDVFALRDPR